MVGHTELQNAHPLSRWIGTTVYINGIENEEHKQTYERRNLFLSQRKLAEGDVIRLPAPDRQAIPATEWVLENAWKLFVRRPGCMAVA